MRFIYKHGYTCFMGRMFAFKKSVEVTDKATMAALLKHPDFERVDNDEKAKAEAPAPAPVLKRPVLSLRKGR